MADNWKLDEYSYAFAATSMNRQGRTQSRRHEKRRGASRAFTLVEVLIVVAILGILAAVIIPEYKGHTQRAKEASAKENIQMLRSVIERYAVQHNGVPPGYPLNDRSCTPIPLAFYRRLIQIEHYLSTIPTNPFNGRATVTIITDDEPFPTEADGSSGWIYKPATKEIRLDRQGMDSEGTAYFDY